MVKLEFVPLQVDVSRDEAEQYAEKLKESDTCLELVVMQVDILRDEAEQYAEKLKESGTFVELVRMKGHCHNSMLRLDLFNGTGDSGFDAKTTYQNIGAFLHKAFKT